MTTAVQEFRQLYQVKTWDNEVFFIPEEHHQDFIRDWKSPSVKVVSIGVKTIATSSIKTVEPASCHPDLARFPQEIREVVELRAKQYQDNLGRPPTDEQKLNWANRSNSGEHILLSIAIRNDE